MLLKCANELADALAARDPRQQEEHLTLVAMLLSHLYRVYDASGISSGRSWESRMVEPALRLMEPWRLKRDIVEWPDREQTIRAAEDCARQLNLSNDLLTQAGDPRLPEGQERGRREEPQE